MIIRSVFLLLITLSSFSAVIGQMQTVELEEVVIESLPFEKYSSGSKLNKSDSLNMNRLNNRTLADYLQQNSTVYIKEQGNAMLASVSFRGTGSSHTGVFWHGINVNSLTLGITDFNSVPLFLFDDLAIQYGGASSLHGSDAIGGSIHLGSGPSWTNGSKIQFRQDIGSFGHYFSGIKLDLGNGKWESKTRIFNRSLKNNFTYTIEDRLGMEYDIEQENAQLHTYGILQEFSGQVATSGYLSIKGWYSNDDRQAQPLMVTLPNEQQNGDEVHNRNLRMIAKYDHFFNRGILSSSIGYVWDYQLFNKSDLIETERSFAQLEYEYNLGAKTILRTGGKGSYIVPQVWSYEKNAEEWRGDVYFSVSREIIADWKMNLNARKTFVPFTNAPLAPSLSMDYVIKAPKSKMVFRGQAERSYRVPTFNDRYWGEEGRRDLNSESGYSMEIGYNLQRSLPSGIMEWDIAGFYMNIDDWIAWKPSGDLWRPFNLKEVTSSGIEIQAKYQHQINSIHFEIGGMYAYNKAILLRGISENDPAVGHQLPYTPKHRWTVFGNIKYRNYQLSLNSRFTGDRRGIDVINEQVNAFFLTDIHLVRNFSFGRHLLALEGQVLNLFDVDYQNVNRYAMPGRNYSLSINLFLNN